MRASNRGKVKKKSQYFIYNSTTIYKSNKNYIQKIKVHGFIPWASNTRQKLQIKIFETITVL